MAPPPTANIQRRPDGMPVGQQQQQHPDISPLEPGAEFAPNADYTQPPPQSPASPAWQPHHGQQQQPLQPMGAPESHWYDRIFDVLLGEDETAPKNRIVLICKSCRLVNGQAPPGVKKLSEMGTWRCMACGTPNGEVAEDEGQRIVREVLNENQQQSTGVMGAGAEDDAESLSSEDDEQADDVELKKQLEGAASGPRLRRGKAA